MINATPAPTLEPARPAVTHQAPPVLIPSLGDMPAVTAPGAVTPSASPKKEKNKPAPRAGVFKRTAGGMSVTKLGRVQIENEQVLREIPLFYYSERGQWFFGDGRGNFTKVPDSQAKSFVALFGFNKNLPDPNGNTNAELAMMWLMQNKRVDYAGQLAGYRAGFYETGGTRFLVTSSPEFITPKAGKCATIRLLVESLFFEEDRKQIIYFYLWLSKSFSEFNARMFAKGACDKFRHCPALAIFGPRGCGKSALIDLVIAPLFGGKKADPMNFLRDPKFNKDLFPASLLVLDDKGATSNIAERRQRGEAMKDLIWKGEQRMEGKGADALNLHPWWRMVIAGNDDDGGLQVCPALTESLEDKLLILHAAHAEGLPTSDESNDEWAANIRAELPAFAAFLLKWRVPADIAVDDRTRVARFQHPKIVSALREMQPEIGLLEMIDTLGLIKSPESKWEGKATEFHNDMKQRDTQGLLDRIFISTTSTGRMLTELSRVAPDRVKKTDRDGVSHYRIYPAKDSRETKG